MELCNAGYEAKEALTIVNGNRPPQPSDVSHFKNRYKKYSLLHPQTVKLANSVILNVLRGEQRQVPQQRVTKSGEVVDIIETITPSHTNQLEAAKMVYDRFEPVIKINENNNNNTDMLGMVVLALTSPNKTESREILGKGKVEQEPDAIDVQPVDKELSTTTGQSS